MGRSLTILHTADSHIGAELPARPRSPGRRRGDDFVDAFAHVLGQAIQRDVDLVIHAGDLFDRSKPHSRALVSASQPLLDVAAAGIPVVVVPGNHERSTIPSCLFLSHTNIHIIAEPCTLVFDCRGTRVAIASFPCLRRNSAKRFGEALASTGWAKTRADVHILAVHQTFESARCGLADYRFRSGDDVIERDAVPATFDYVAAGHVHRHQTLSTAPDRPAIVYAGSPDRISFAEADEPKGYLMLEETGGRLVHSFIEHEVRPMATRPMDVSGLSRAEMLQRIDVVLEELPRNAVAQVRLTGFSSGDALRGLKITRRARELRPDVLFSVTAQAVELAPHFQARRRPVERMSAFAHLDVPPEPLVRTSVQDLSLLPAGLGVYAMYDQAGRLLYIGKSGNVRGRIASHLCGGTRANYFRGWARQAADVEVRLGDSELEALLIEAELIRVLRPPFNRQMRRWSGYCYLAESEKVKGQLEVRPKPTIRPLCFGPFRSRRMAVSIGEAAAAHFGLGFRLERRHVHRFQRRLSPPLAFGNQRKSHNDVTARGFTHSINPDGLDARVHRCRNVFLGIDDQDVRELEARRDATPEEDRETKLFEEIAFRAMTLRLVFDHAAILRKAESLLNTLLLFPARNGVRKTARLTTRGIHFGVLRHKTADTESVLTRRQLPPWNQNGMNHGRLPKMIADSLCIVVRQFERLFGQYEFHGCGGLEGLQDRVYFP